MSSTVNCIECFKEAKNWGGHVHKENEMIIAGFCNDHFNNTKGYKDCKGCFGIWSSEMGYDKSFGELVYIEI